MRKFFLLTTSCMVVAATVGTGTASAEPTVFPDCVQYGNEFGVQKLTVDTKSDLAYAPSGSNGVMLFCGAAPDPGIFNCSRGAQTLYDKAVLTYPPQTRFTDTSGVAPGSYVGTSFIGTIGIVLCTGQVIEDDPIPIEAYPPGYSNASPFCDDDANGEVVACFFAYSPGLFHYWQAVRKTRIEGQTRFQLYIYPILSIIGDLTLAKIDWDFCTNYGDPGTTTCGDANDPPTAYNGSASAPDCSNGNGIFSATVTNRNGQVSDPKTTCVPWTPRNFAYREFPTN